MDTIDGAGQVGRGRRRHSAEFKAEVAQACCRPGMSIASVALSYGLNANLLRRWLTQRSATQPALAVREPLALVDEVAAAGADKFVPVKVEAGPTPLADIRIELRRGPSSVSVSWPVQEAAACGTWLREWLR